MFNNKQFNIYIYKGVRYVALHRLHRIIPQKLSFCSSVFIAHIY